MKRVSQKRKGQREKGSMKVKINSDEWYPMYFISDEYGEEVEAKNAKVAEWKRVFAEFLRVQDEMKAAANKQQTPEPQSHEKTPF
jgi:hypothetical protein